MTSKSQNLFTVSVDAVDILFDPDTGSDVSCIGRHHLEQLQQQRLQQQQPQQRLQQPQVSIMIENE